MNDRVDMALAVLSYRHPEDGVRVARTLELFRAYDRWIKDGIAGDPSAEQRNRAEVGYVKEIRRILFWEAQTPSTNQDLRNLAEQYMESFMRDWRAAQQWKELGFPQRLGEKE